MDAVTNIIIKVEKLKENKDFVSAIKILEESIIKYHDDYRLYEELADIYLYKWSIVKALKSVNFALELNPESATWNYLKWFILLTKENLSEAIKYLENSNKLIWNNPEVLRNMWWAYNMIWERDKWISILKRALTLLPEDPLIIEDLAMALISNWNIKEWNNLLLKIGKNAIL